MKFKITKTFFTLFLAFSFSEANSLAVNSIELQKSHILHQEVDITPSSYQFAGMLIDFGDWGEGLDENEIQGITHSDDFWYVTNQWEIYKLDKNFKVVANNKLMRIQLKLSNGFYRHFGGISYYKGYIYIAVTGRSHIFSKTRANPIVVVYDENLNFVKYGEFPINKQKGAGWLAINPVNGHLYSSSPHRLLHEYSLDFEDGDTLKWINSYHIEYTNASLSEEEWQDIPNQGGVFSNSGILYYVLDKKDSHHDESTGIHGFILEGTTAKEFNFYGLNNSRKTTPFISIIYNGNQKKDRLWELEDVDFETVDGVDYLYHLQLLNGKNDNARVMKYILQ